MHQVFSAFSEEELESARSSATETYLSNLKRLLKSTTDAAIGLHLISLLLFSIAHPRKIINFSGKLVPKILKFLKSSVEVSDQDQLFEKLSKCQKAVVSGTGDVAADLEYLKEYVINKC